MSEVAIGNDLKWIQIISNECDRDNMLPISHLCASVLCFFYRIGIKALSYTPQCVRWISWNCDDVFDVITEVFLLGHLYTLSNFFHAQHNWVVNVYINDNSMTWLPTQEQ